MARSPKQSDKASFRLRCGVSKFLRHLQGAVVPERAVAATFSSAHARQQASRKVSTRPTCPFAERPDKLKHSRLYTGKLELRARTFAKLHFGSNHHLAVKTTSGTISLVASVKRACLSIRRNKR